MRFKLALFVLLTGSLLTACEKTPKEAIHVTASTQNTDQAEAIQSDRPNILLIVVDDLGYSDIGAFGSEIKTPTIDQLVAEGVHLQNFYAAPTCSPTRSMLLTGVDNHVAGVGTMQNNQTSDQKGKPGYEGYLNFGVAALPEILQEAGYNTYMTGKWHLGATVETSPMARGFDRSFTLLPGGAGAFANRLQIYGEKLAQYREDADLVETLPEDFYSTAFYTDRMMEYIESGRSNGKPFFAYLAYTSPHWPLQAPDESIARYKGVYDDGYAALREKRLASAKALGLTPGDAELFPQLTDIPNWESLSAEEKAYQARLMEIFAAMVDDVDRHLGRLITYLKDTGQFDNTAIFFMADNGPEGNDLTVLRDTVPNCCDNSYENLGKPDSYMWYGAAWAQAGNVPRRMYKSFTAEGGIAVPAFFHYASVAHRGERIKELLSVRDITPTLLDLAEVDHPAPAFKGRDVAEMTGSSLLPMLKGEAERAHDEDAIFGTELFGRKAIRQGDWKAVYLPEHEPRTGGISGVIFDQWQLYNLAQDPAEMHDLAEQHPEKLAELVALFDTYTQENNVILSSEAKPY